MMNILVELVVIWRITVKIKQGVVSEVTFLELDFLTWLDSDFDKDVTLIRREQMVLILK